jgi:uncharacterized membrane protein
MAQQAADWPILLAGTFLLRPYVFVFLATFLFLAARDLGWRRTWGWLGWGWAVAYVAEYASTRIGFPFGLYHYTGETAWRELFVSNVPFFDPLSFPFLAYASYCLARWALGQARGWAPAALTGVLIMLLDVVVDPLAVRGESWFSSVGRSWAATVGPLHIGFVSSSTSGHRLDRGKNPAGGRNHRACGRFSVSLFSQGHTGDTGVDG